MAGNRSLHLVRFPKVILLLTSIFIVFKVNSAEVNLKEAIRKGLVKAVITSNPGDTSAGYQSSYYGPCLTVSLQSVAKTSLQVRIESGQLIETADSSEQRMVITLDRLIVLQPSAKKTLDLFAMCTQMHDRSPGKESLLTLGNMAEGNLLSMAQFISSNNFQSQAAQQAIWVLTDNNDPGSIYSGNKEEMDKLQSLVCRLTGKMPPPVPHSIFYSSGMVSGEIIFDNKHSETYSFVMMNEAGEKIGTFFENKTISQPMLTTLTWRFRFKGFPKGVYYVKLLNSVNESVVTRPVVIE
jgi:hypothetical protein